LHTPSLFIFFSSSSWRYNERDTLSWVACVGGQLGGRSRFWSRGLRETPQRSIRRGCRKKARLVPVVRNTAWAAIEGQGERVWLKTSEEAAMRACVRACLVAVHGRSPNALRVAFVFFFLSFLLRQRKETLFASQYKYWPFRGNSDGIDYVWPSCIETYYQKPHIIYSSIAHAACRF